MPLPTNAFVRWPHHLARLISLFALALFVLGVSASISPQAPWISSISLEGSNLLIMVQAPAGIGELTLESRTLAPGSRWQDMATQTCDTNGAVVIFRVLKPADMLVYRVRTPERSTDPGIDPNPPELRFVTTDPVRATNRPIPITDARHTTHSPCKTVVVRFRAKCDGSDRIRVTHAGALWEHVNWGWPVGPVSINDVAWTPSSKNVFAPPGASSWLPSEIQFASAKLKIIKGRDTVACEHDREGITIHLNDSPPGADDYEFELHLATAAPERAPHSPAQPARLHISARIDGSDRLVISRSGARWIHKFYEWPQAVRMNGTKWAPETGPVLPNQDATRFLPANVDFASARISNRRGRDLIALESQPDSITVHFVDNPNGSDLYEVDIDFDVHPGR